jgi:hypothetical protein
MNLGREALPWSQDLWASLDQAVHNEVERTGVAARFIPPLDRLDPARVHGSLDRVQRGTSSANSYEIRHLLQ